VEIQGKYYLDDIYNVKGKDRGGHYLPEVVVTGKKRQGGKMNILEFLKNGGQVRKMQTAAGGPIYANGQYKIPRKRKVTDTIKLNNGVLTHEVDD